MKKGRVYVRRPGVKEDSIKHVGGADEVFELCRWSVFTCRLHTLLLIHFHDFSTSADRCSDGCD